VNGGHRKQTFGRFGRLSDRASMVVGGARVAVPNGIAGYLYLGSLTNSPHQNLCYLPGSRCSLPYLTSMPLPCALLAFVLSPVNSGILS